MTEVTERTPMFDEVTIEDEIIENPFKDPAITEVTTANLDLEIRPYEPFKPPNYLPPEIQGKQAKDSYTSIELEPSNAIKYSIQELQKRQEELERREEELAKKEEELRKGAFHVRPNNWPPLPKSCCFQPCFFQDIDLEIPVEFQNIVKKLYKLWLYHEVVMVTNVFSGIVSFDANVIGLGLLYLLLYTPFSYLCWFRPVYRAFRSDSSINFMVFFFMFFLQFIITFMQGVGLPGSGTMGFIAVIRGFSMGRLGFFSGVICLFVAAGFCSAAAADFIFLGKVHRIYRKTGASFAKAQEEFAANFLQSDYIRGVTLQNLGQRN